MSLVGAIVQDVAFSPAAATLRVRAPGATLWILLSCVRGASGVGALVNEEKRALFSGKLPHGMRVSKPPLDVVGARIAAIDAERVVLEMSAEIVVMQTRAARVTFVRAGLPFDDADRDARPSDEPDAAFARGAQIATAWVVYAIESARRDATIAVDRGIARLSRRADAVRGDLAKMADAETMIATAQWLVAAAARAERGARELAIEDWSTGEARVVRVAIDPAKPARDQVEAMFKRAKRLRAGRAFAAPRLAECERVLNALREVHATLLSAMTLDAIQDLAAKAKSIAPRDVRIVSATDADAARPGRRERDLPQKVYRAFLCHRDARVLVGKGAAQNDVLTFRIARPHDLWLHAKNRTGAHVVVPLHKGRLCPPLLLIDAAHLAAHFSESRDELVVDVEYTYRKFLRKPKGGAAGLAVVERERVIVLRVERARIAALLEREET